MKLQKIENKPARGTLSVILTVGSIGLLGTITGCGLSAEEIEAARKNGIVFYWNGAFSLDAQIVAGKIAKELGMACLSGRKDFKDVYKDGEKSIYGNHAMFHSMGELGAHDFTNWCHREGIYLETGHSVGSGFGLHFSNSVGEIFNYESDYPWTERASTGGRIAHPMKVVKGSFHPWLPGYAKQTIKNRIQNAKSNRQERVYQRIPTKSGR